MDGIDDGTFEAAWKSLTADAAVTAEEYREDGWEAHVLEPGDVTPVVDDDRPFGLSVLVDSAAYDLVESLSKAVSFDDCEVYRHVTGPLVSLLIVERSEAAETALLIPAYYNTTSAAGFVDTARERGEVPIHLRALGTDHITVTHEHVDVFLPPEDE